MHTVPRTSGAGVASGPTVEMTRCVLGHANPPHARSCRICKEPVPQQEPVWAARPPLGVLRLSTGDEVLLDRGVILGRAPGAPEGSGRDEPNRYKLPSSDGSMSRKHCEVVLDGWSVYVVDLKSMNGTAVTPPGGPPEWLVPEVPRPIEDGWTVNLDPTTWFRYEVTE
jgi:hypothetical protein